MYTSQRQQNTKNPMLKVVILGDGGVGKSCLMNCFVNNQFDQDSFHTIGVEFLNKNIVINNETYTLQIWDTAGQERFKSLRTPFYRGSDICMLTYAVNDRNSFRNLMLWRNEFLYYADVKDGSSFPFILVGNKDDVAPEERQVSYAEAMAWCQENGNPPFIETSAKTAENVELAFDIAVKHWARLEANLDRPYIGETIDLGHESSQQSGRSLKIGQVYVCLKETMSDKFCKLKEEMLNVVAQIVKLWLYDLIFVIPIPRLKMPVVNDLFCIPYRDYIIFRNMVI